ncbi:adenosylmethionine-8-amino-7-oxononanoate aminotransferase [Rhizobium sp. ERR 922]|uniref:Aspartate aminotransferase family protein n=1 Tax=Rhizobium dioscoreae TaxID=2653122 RepID=A0ABQ0Z9Q7_9HYPH|nr:MULTISPECIES: aspartate aminotransferase family protein [Rhizobium]TWB49011.1 adenosylmethionine-8-amino-7-oxononanoate aminotransferase [Rhizobium sp. ERR 922]TWB91543.1 adenosylmethionine-8-amino-7-oxononanoate aminotransferase [Rhizobium sp. ERR 942]GES52052.1 aspartate aminotransferase family protein [Rhizobium dioscoreae]GLU83229.1 aspartate aminotransferase family protein [Rhizobium sp. NBRC 114257]
MTKILHRSIASDLPHAVAGEGVYIIDSEGRHYLDGSGGAAVSCLGHNHPEVLEAMREQMGRISYAHTSFFTTDAAEELAEKLVVLTPEGLDYVYLVSGGSEAVEAALKMARQYFVEIGQPQRRHIIARRQSYHGNTIGALAAGGNAWRRAQFQPILPETHHISPCYAYRDKLPQETPEAYATRLAAELEAKILELGPDQVMTFIAEPVVGATLGAVGPIADYFKKIRHICDKYGVLLILDEVMCGMGRTGTIFALEQEGIVPDLVTIAKGLGGGFQPIGAVMLSRRIYKAFAEGSGLFQHGHTYIGHPMAAAAANKVVEILTRPGLMENVAVMGERLQAGLEARLGGSPYVGDIRGRGLFRGVELVAERDSKTPFDPARKIHARIKKEAMQRGLMCYPMGGTIDGRYGDHVLLAPAYIIREDEIDMIADRLTDAIHAAVTA